MDVSSILVKFVHTLHLMTVATTITVIIIMIVSTIILYATMLIDDKTPWGFQT